MKPDCMFERDTDCLMILPFLSVQNVKCGDCDDIHGTSVSMGWLFWTFMMYWPRNNA
jgi:hypothetical protein